MARKMTAEAPVKEAKRAAGAAVKGKSASAAIPAAAAAESATTLLGLARAERAVYKDVSAPAQDDLEVLASRIAVEVTFALSDQVEELAVCNSEFRMGLHRVARWTLTTLFRRAERCVVVPDAVPGYTVMAFKKPAGAGEPRVKAKGGEAQALAPESPEASATALIIDRFLGKASHQILVIEAPDVLLTLFPVPDLRKNLKDLGFYITE